MADRKYRIKKNSSSNASLLILYLNTTFEPSVPKIVPVLSTSWQLYAAVALSSIVNVYSCSLLLSVAAILPVTFLKYVLLIFCIVAAGFEPRFVVTFL